MKKNIFDLEFDPTRAPEYCTRGFSMQPLFGGAEINQTYPAFKRGLGDKRDLRKVFKSNRDLRTLPSAWTLMKKVR